MVKLLAAIILIFSSVLAIGSVWNDSPIVDEIPHIGAGYSYIAKNDFRLNPEHPPLVKDLAGLALIPLDLKDSSFQTKFWTQDKNGQWEFGRNFIFNSGNDAIHLVRVAKLPMIIFFILSGLLIFLWTNKLYRGVKAGLLALFLFALSPTVIAHSRFVTTDMAALFGVLFGSYFFLNFLEHSPRSGGAGRSSENLWLAGLAFGIAQLTKFSVILLAPFFLILAVVAGFYIHGRKITNIFKAVWETILVFVIGFIFIVWPVYALHTVNYPSQRQHADTEYFLGTYGNRLFADPVLWASDKPFLRPLAYYATGLLMVNQRAIGGNTTYFLGEVRDDAWKSYFPVVYFIKEPLAFWFLVGIVLVFLVSRLKVNKYKIIHWPKENFHEFAMLLWLTIYWYISIRSNLNIGVRHLLPIYGFTIILISGQVEKLSQKLKVKSKNLLYTFYFTLFTLLGWYLAETLMVYPYYLTYFNQTVGGPTNGYKYVVDSNLDWGQDLKRLAEWVDKNNIKNLHLDYFGWADQSYYLGKDWVWVVKGRYPNAQNFFKENPNGGYLAVSGTYYMGSRELPSTSYAWLDSYKPVAVIGNSIFVWNLTP